jgi:hypothetical protein
MKKMGGGVGWGGGGGVGSIVSHAHHSLFHVAQKKEKDKDKDKKLEKKKSRRATYATGEIYMPADGWWWFLAMCTQLLSLCALALTNSMHSYEKKKVQPDVCGRKRALIRPHHHLLHHLLHLHLRRPLLRVSDSCASLIHYLRVRLSWTDSCPVPVQTPKKD